jgi:hypothetical protein
VRNCSPLKMRTGRLSRMCSSRERWLVAAAIAFLTAYANAESASIYVEARFIDVKGDLVAVDRRPRGSSLTLGVIPGAISGNPTRVLQVDHIGKESGIEIDLGSFEEAIAGHSAPMTAAFAESGLRVDPVETRFARASTLLTYTGVLREDLLVEFADQDSKNPMTLVYFDRPCHLTGSKATINAATEKLILTYDVTIEKAGLNWLIRTPNGADGFIYRAAIESIQQMLVVAPAKNLKHATVQIN